MRQLPTRTPTRLRTLLQSNWGAGVDERVDMPEPQNSRPNSVQRLLGRLLERAGLGNGVSRLGLKFGYHLFCHQSVR